MSCGLNPITSSNTLRYNNPGCVRLHSEYINRGPTLCIVTDSTSLAPDWHPYTHPEGQPYYVLNNKYEFVVITEANMRDLGTASQIREWAQVANKELQLLDIKVPFRCELFLELGDDQASCNYYFVDHVGKRLFWLEDVCTESLDLPAIASAAHLETMLEKLYWGHVEYFPMHYHSPEEEFSQILDDLCNIISHGQADRLTSRTSTFPYTADMCEQFLNLLSRKRGQRLDGYTLCYAARLAGAIANQRFITLYGHHPAQLDRCQEMFGSYTPSDHKWQSILANGLMWGIPRGYVTRLDDLYVNEQVYVDQWTEFVSKSLADWKGSISYSFGILITSVLLDNVRGATVTVSIPCVITCAISIASASLLHLRHQPFAASSASVGARYLHFAKSSSVGFLPLSVAFSLPRACYLWGVGFLIAQFLLVVFHSVNKYMALVAACGIGVILITLICVTYPEDTDARSYWRTFVSQFAPHYHQVAREAEPMV